MQTTGESPIRSERRLVAGGFTAVLIACSCAPDEGPETISTRVNLILISIDTLRADRLGCYGYDSPTSPTIDALAGRGVVFANTISESSWTLPSTMTLFTGVPPGVHGVTKNAGDDRNVRDRCA